MLTLALRSLSLPPGDLVYHLVVLFAIETIVLMTWRDASRHAGQSRRWAMGAWGLTAGRVLLVLAAVLAAARWIPSATSILAPLERFVEVVSLALLAWTFLPAAEHYPRASNALAAGNLGLAIVFYAWAAPQWFILSQQGIHFNGTTQDAIWGMWALAVAVLSITAALSYRQSGWAVCLIAFVMMAASYALHLVHADPQLNTAEWVRLAGLAVYPLFATRVVGQLATSDTLGLAQHAPTTLDFWPIAEACRAITDGNAPQRLLGPSAEAIAHALDADLVAIGLPGDLPDTVELTGIYCADGALGALPSVPLDAWPALKQAISRKAATLVPVDQAMPFTTALGRLTPRPLLIQPLIHHRETVGVLIASGAKRGLDTATRHDMARAAQTAADHLASALSAARKTEMLSHRVEELTASLGDQETKHFQARLALETQLAHAKADLQSALNQASEAQQQSAHHQRRAAEIAALVELQASAPADWQEQTRQFHAERARAEAEAQRLAGQIESLKQRQAELEIELAQAVAQAQLLPKPSETNVEHPLTLDGTNLGVLITDASGQVMDASPTAARLLGLRHEALIGLPLSQVLADPGWSQVIQTVTQPAGSRADVPVHFDTQNDYGLLHIELTTRESSDSLQSGLVAVVTRTNGTHPEPHHREVIASLTQELRTPMTSISGYTDMLLGETTGILGAMQRQFLLRVKANIERLSGMLDDLIRITAIDARDLKLEPEPINLKEVIEDAITGSSAQFRESTIAVKLDLAERLPPVHADRDSLYQIMSHLLANACLCSRPGTDVIVSAKRSEDGNYLSVSVTDTGGGISPSDQPRVFSRRYRADNPLIEGLGDTGVGLSIAKTLVEAHHGKIWVHSDMGHGSTFTFVLQAAQPVEASS